MWNYVCAVWVLGGALPLGSHTASIPVHVYNNVYCVYNVYATHYSLITQFLLVCHVALFKFNIFKYLK